MLKAMAGFWTALVIASLLWNIFQVKKETVEAAHIQAWSAFRKDVLYRRWNSMLGGVYVPVTERTPPNPYLTNVPERDIQTPSGKRLTLMNPAYMTRLVFELGQKEYGIRSHITSLKPVRPENAPDSWEKKALQAFDLGEKEIYSVETINGQNYLRLMRPLITERSCLLCHAQQGYKENDIRGGISVTIPMQPLLSIQHGTIIRLASINALFWLLGIGGIAFGTVRQIQNDLKRRQDEEALRQARDSLEQQVRERTGELVKTNNALQAETDNLRQTEQMLRASEEKYRELFEQAGDYILVLEVKEDVGLVIADANQAACEIHGYTREEFLGTPIRDIDRGLDKEQARALLDRVMAGESLLLETAHVKKDGTIFPIEVSSKLLDTGEDPPLIISIERDITERKQAEEALRESEEKYRLLIENANDAIFIGQDEGVKFPNPKGEEMTGYSAEELAKMPFVNLIHPDDRDMVLDRHKKRLSGGTLPETYDFRIINKAGETLRVELNTGVINWEGRPATLNLLRDITQQKKLEAQLQQTHKMEAIATLAGGIAHEFNNALTGVVGNIQLLEMDFADNKTVTVYTEAMKTSSHRMANLTSQLLAYAQGGRYQAKTMSMSNFVEDTLPIIKSNIDPSIRLETDLPRDIFSVEADPAQMQMVLSAVVSNSTEAIEGDGRIRITASNEEIDSEFAKNHPELNPGNYVCLTVEDDGKGMDEETVNKIFDPFYTTKFTGRGLGMAAVYGIVRNHKGWITVDSELNKGTIIRIYLPGIETEEVKKEAIVESATEMPKGEGTILIIEDEETVMNVIRAVLERLGYRMLEAKTGREAVEIAKTFDGEIDLALLDIKLPDIRGDKVYPLIMKARPNLKVIVCSGYSIDTARGILDAGAQDFIQKPFNVKELSQKLRWILEKE